MATTGIRVRHSRSCKNPDVERCGCRRAYQAWVYSKRDGKKIVHTFPTLAAAKAWRADAQTAVRKRTMRAPLKTALSEAAAAWLAGAKDGTIRDRSGSPYKPATIRAYQAALDKGVLDEFGNVKLSELARLDLQDLAERWHAEGMHPSTIGGRIMPVTAIYRRAMARGDVAVNATTGLTLAAVRSGRDRVASPRKRQRLSRRSRRKTARSGRPRRTPACAAVS